MSDFKLEKETDGVVSKTIIEKQRNELLRLLDSATDGWIDFMAKAGQYLGEAATGRPKKASLEKTMVGALGFNGWKEMIEAKREIGGLEWKYSKWQEWQKAYALIKLYPRLVDRKPTPAEINRLNGLAKITAIANGEVKDKDKPIQQPTLELWDQAVEQAQANKEKAKAEKVEQVKTELTEASQKLAEAVLKLSTQSVALDAEKRLNAKLEAQVLELREQARVSNENLNLLTKSIAAKDDDLKRTAGERNKAREAVVNATKKVEQQEQRLKAKVDEIKKLTRSLESLKNRSFLGRLFNTK